MSKVIEGLLYSESHEWVKVEDGIAVIGITDFAQQRPFLSCFMHCRGD